MNLPRSSVVTVDVAEDVMDVVPVLVPVDVCDVETEDVAVLLSVEVRVDVTVVTTVEDAVVVPVVLPELVPVEVSEVVMLVVAVELMLEVAVELTEDVTVLETVDVAVDVCDVVGDVNVHLCSVPSSWCVMAADIHFAVWAQLPSSARYPSTQSTVPSSWNVSTLCAFRRPSLAAEHLLPPTADSVIMEPPSAASTSSHSSSPGLPVQSAIMWFKMLFCSSQSTPPFTTIKSIPYSVAHVSPPSTSTPSAKPG